MELNNNIFKIKKLKYFYYFIILLILQLNFIYCIKKSEIPPIVEKGILDLNNWDFYQKGVIPLNGEWEFYYNKLLYPEDFKNQSLQPTMYLKSPSSWDDYNFPLKGYATYRIKIIHLNNPITLGFKIPHMNSSYRLYINNKLIAKNGNVNTDPKLYIPQHLPMIKIYHAIDSEIEIVLQIANFDDNISGIWTSIILGTEEQIIELFWISIGLELFFFGAIFIMGLYHFFLYFFRNQEKGSLYFGLFCILMAIRISITGDKFLLQFFPFFPWELHIKLEYLSLYLGLPAFSFFLFNYESINKYKNNHRDLSLFIKEEFYYPIIKFIYYFSLPFIIITIFTNVDFFGIFLNIYQIFIIIVSFYLIIGMILATKKRKEGAVFSLIGIIIPFITLINDILSAKRIIQTPYTFPIGIFIFILFQSLSLAYKFSLSFFHIENLTNKLKKLLLVFEKFIPKEFLLFLNKNDISQVQLGDQTQKEMTIMFSDIRNFTLISERLSPKENFEFINNYLRIIEPCIKQNNGFIDKYLGDGFMALFGNSPEDALKTSIEIMIVLNSFNENLKENNLEPITIGIGIHTGLIMLGVIGSENHMETTVISDVVNTTSRLEKLNKEFGTNILISDSSIRCIKNKEKYLYRYIGNILLRGKTSPIKIYEIFNHYPEYIKNLYKDTQIDFYKGIHYFSKNKIQEAYEIFEKILSTNPFDNPARYYHFKCRNLIGI